MTGASRDARCVQVDALNQMLGEDEGSHLKLISVRIDRCLKAQRYSFTLNISSWYHGQLLYCLLLSV